MCWIFFLGLVVSGADCSNDYFHHRESPHLFDMWCLDSTCLHFSRSGESLPKASLHLSRAGQMAKHVEPDAGCLEDSVGIYRPYNRLYSNANNDS